MKFEYLNIGFNYLKSVKSLKETEIVELDLRLNKLEKVPKFNCIIRYLDLSFNFIKEIDSNISNYVNLRYLDLSFNKIEKICFNISCCINLEYLDLSFNLLKVVPKSLINIDKLKVLDLRGNNIDRNGDEFSLGREEILFHFGDIVLIDEEFSFYGVDNGKKYSDENVSNDDELGIEKIYNRHDVIDSDFINENVSNDDELGNEKIYNRHDVIDSDFINENTLKNSGRKFKNNKYLIENDSIDVEVIEKENKREVLDELNNIGKDEFEDDNYEKINSTNNSFVYKNFKENDFNDQILINKNKTKQNKFNNDKKIIL
ncbi:at2g17440-like protein [Vairimorpha apis BRL 01]|uniref:At2g17440-like protein n=1 Tax=Vairimorpha apis BRL 01 TaxID=1037528 RepID=T0L8G8_9MICR|nr:at2g17440-like protein [Vairimorpha apis BRL 01]